MAVASKEMYSVFSENFLTCHICLGEYKDPRVLPCNHTFCLECIADHAAKNGDQNKFFCPVCRQEAPVPPDVVKAQRVIIQAKLRCLPNGKLSRFEKVEKAIVRTEERLTENQTKILRLVDSQKLAMTKQIIKNSKTIERELTDYYQQVEKYVREQTDAYLVDVKQHLETCRTKVQSDYTKMKRCLDEKSNTISEEVKGLTSTQVKTLEAEKDRLEMNKISIQTINDFAQQLTNTGSDIEVMTHSKILQTRIQELQNVEPVFDTEITDITFTPGQTNMDVVLQLPKIPEPRLLTIKPGSITAKTSRKMPMDACFGSLNQERAYYTVPKEFQKAKFLGCLKRGTCFNVKGWPWDIQCIDYGCYLVVHGITVSIFFSTGQCNREISIEGKARIAIPMCSNGALRCAYHHGINAIIVSDRLAHSVYAVTPQGDVMFQYGVRYQIESGGEELNDPRGICVDMFGHIFIADCRNDRVVVLGSDGRFLRRILTWIDDIRYPLSVDANSNGELVVGTASGKLSTYRFIAQHSDGMT
ncbi:RING finger protein nhl-1-like [Lingula anatina]|uniref:RING finger protein nhl-1-like n=1 Tax=Lingula anatina TaxID=7574 RepID=A0A1S3ITV4_LINAN|nr:RING finger protein nhl-1-like [Lingula anatina]|eukprot:XP_013401366.1 RING finger protein nhl-1-like [Lingula anatina]